jgi:hypothetical protein
MSTRIFFNGQQYPSVEAMPDDVRKLYDQSLTQLADKDHDGIPDILQGRGDAGQNVMGVRQSSITVNGKTYNSLDELPLPLQLLVGAAMRQMIPPQASAPDPSAGSLPKPESASPAASDHGLLRALDRTENVLTTLLLALLSGAAGVIIVVGSWMITHMSASERSQGGAVYVGLGMAVVLGAIAIQLVKIWMRRQRSGQRDVSS